MTYAGADVVHEGAIRRSYEIDFVNVTLDGVSDGEALTIEFEGARNGDAHFIIQVWKLADRGPGARPGPVAEQAAGPEVLRRPRGSGPLTYSVPAIDLAEFNRLALIITRVDAAEQSDPIGEYTIRLRPGGGV